MNDRGAHTWLRERLGTLNTAAAAGLSVLALGLSALVLSYAGTLSLALAPWSAIAMPAGLALAAQWRWGGNVLIGIAVGTMAALLGSGMGWGASVLGASVVAVSSMLAHAVMKRLEFDARFERPADVGILAGAATGHIFASYETLALLPAVRSIDAGTLDISGL